MFKNYQFLCVLCIVACSFLQAASQQIELVKEINGPTLMVGVNEGGNPTSFTELNGKLYFTANHRDYAREIWVSSGTESSTHLLINFNKEQLGLYSNLQKLGNKIVFYTDISTNGPGQNFDTTLGGELYITDGTAAGIELLKEISPGMHPNGFPNSSYADIDHGVMNTTNNQLYFCASDSLLATSLWVTDGTTAGTMRIKRHEFGVSNITFLGITQNKFFYFIWTSEGCELWASDGTNGGTQKIRNILCDPSNCIAIDGKLYFQTYEQSGGIGQFWVSDGTSNGTIMLSDKIRFNARSLTKYHNKMYFFSNVPEADFGNAIFSRKFCFTDGTVQGTDYFDKIVVSPHGTFQPIPIFNQKMYLAAADTQTLVTNPSVDINSGNFELWESDGTEAGTLLKADIAQAGYSLSSKPSDFFQYNQKLYFLTTIVYPDTTNIPVQRSVYSMDSAGAIVENLHDQGFNFYVLKDQYGQLVQFPAGFIVNYSSGPGYPNELRVFKDSLHNIGSVVSVDGWSEHKNNFYSFGNDYYFTATASLDPTEMYIMGNQLFKMKALNSNHLTNVKKGITDVIIYPNPATESIFINHKKDAVYSIRTIAGNEVKRGRFKDNGINKISTDQLNNGLYIIIINKDNQTQTGKFIIKK